MSQFKPLHLFGIVITIISFALAPQYSQAATAKVKHKAAEQREKDRLVLMPLRIPEEDKDLAGAMETALVNGLQQKYDIFSGEQVSQKAHEIFMKESRDLSHKDCDETRCMQNIAIAFQSELIATANVTKKEGSYFLALSIQNIFNNKVVLSESVTCEKCTAVQVIEKLKELSGTVVSVASESSSPNASYATTFDLSTAKPVYASTSEAYEFAKAAISSFAVIKDASSNVAVKKVDNNEMIREYMKNALRQQRAFGTAESQMKDFDNSDDPEIKQVAALLSGPFFMFKVTSEQVATECEKFLNSSKREVLDTNGSISKRFFELADQTSANWDTYVKISGAVSLALTDSNRTVDGKLSYLKITKAEREKLKKQLVLAFGVAVKKGATDKTPRIILPAIFLWDFLSDKWLAADSN